MPEIENRLEKIEEKIDMIVETMGRMAVQKEQISAMQNNLANMSQRMDRFRADITTLQLWQASCPRVSLNEVDKAMQSSIRDIWVALLTIGATLVTVFIWHIFSTSPK